MKKPWKCRIGLHRYVSTLKYDFKNRKYSVLRVKTCLSCDKKTTEVVNEQPYGRILLG